MEWLGRGIVVLIFGLVDLSKVKLEDYERYFILPERPEPDRPLHPRPEDDLLLLGQVLSSGFEVDNFVDEAGKSRGLVHL